jgi:hypothetical protein
MSLTNDPRIQAVVRRYAAEVQTTGPPGLWDAVAGVAGDLRWPVPGPEFDALYADARALVEVVIDARVIVGAVDLDFAAALDRAAAG